MALGKLIDRTTLTIIVVMYIYGAFLAIIYLVPTWALRQSWPDWPWWLYLIAPIALGIVALLVEWAFSPIPKWLEWGNKDAPQWKRAASFSLVFFGGIGLIAIPMLVQTWWGN